MKRKLYKCIDCRREVPIRSHKRCPYCASKKRSQEKPTIPSKIKKVSKKRSNELKEKKDKLDPFFEYHIGQIKKHPYCQNCGTKLKGTRDEVGHILPKRKTKHPEVMDNKNNALYLCCMFSENNCHDKFDKIQTTQRVYLMPVWDLAVEKYLLLKPFLKNQTKERRIFEDYLENKE